MQKAPIAPQQRETAYCRLCGTAAFPASKSCVQCGYEFGAGEVHIRGPRRKIAVLIGLCVSLWATIEALS
ncbi:MAG: hypothetical protein QM605_17075 [Sphingobium sp.]